MNSRPDMRGKYQSRFPLSSSIALIILAILCVGFLFKDNSAKLDISRLKDTSESLTYEQIMKNEQLNFSEVSRQYFSTNGSDSVQWIKINKSNAAAEQRFLIVYDYSEKSAVLYIPTTDGASYYTIDSGSGSLNRNNGYTAYTVFVLPEGSANNMVLKLQTANHIGLSFGLFTENQYNHIRIRDFLFCTILIATLLAAIIYNIYLTYSLKAKKLISYSIFLIFTLSYYFFLNFLPWVVSPTVKNQISQDNVFLYIAYLRTITGLYYIRTIVGTFKKHLLINSFLYVLIGISIVGLSLALFGQLKMSLILSLLLTKISFIFIAVAAIYAFITHEEYVTNLFFASIICAFGYIPILMSLLGFDMNCYSFLFIPEISWVIATASISFVLSERLDDVKWSIKHTQFLISDLNKRTASSLLAAQKAQINKRLLFDALDNSYELCTTNPDKSVSLMLNLSEFLNYNFNFDDIPFVTLKDAIKELETYIRLEKAIGKNNFDITYRLEYDGGIMMPPMILQPLVENAILHGFKDFSKAGKIKVEVQAYKDYYYFSVEDNGVGMPTRKIRESLTRSKNNDYCSLAQIDRQLFSLYRQRLHIYSSINNGTKVSFKLPKAGGSKAV